MLQTLHRLTVAQQRAARPPRPMATLAPAVTSPIADVAAQELEAIAVEAVEEAGPATHGDDTPGALDRLDQPAISAPVKLVFHCWVIVFGLVGAQMGWVLRPFIGDPNREFMWFRARDSNFLQAVWNALLGMFS